MIHKTDKETGSVYFTAFVMLVALLLGAFSMACEKKKENSPEKASLAYESSENAENATSGKSSLKEAFSKKAAEEAAPVSWNLSREAKKTFYYLAMLEESHSPDKKAAVAAILELCKINPSPSSYYDGASRLFLTNNIAEALLVGSEGLRRYPDNSNLLLLMAEINLAVGDKDGNSIQYLSKAVKAGVDTPEKVLRIVDTLIKSKRYKAAEEIFALVPEPREKMPRRGEKNPRQGEKESEQGEKKLDNDEGKGTSLAVYLYMKARIIAVKGEHEEAKVLLERAVTLEPEFSEGWAELAFWREKGGDTRGAEEAYNKLLGLDPDNGAVWIALVRVNIKLERPDEAIALVFKGPQNFPYFMSAAMLFTEAKLYPQAEEIYLKAAKLPDATDDVYRYLSYVSYETTKDVETAVAWLDKVKKDSPLYLQTMLLKVQAYGDAGRYDEALAFVREKEKEMPTQKEFYMAEIGTLYKMKKTDEVDAAFKRALKKFPNDADILFSKGAYLSETGKKDQAMQVMEEVIRLYPKNAAALNYVGYTLANSSTSSGKDLSRAYILIKEALAEEPNNPGIIDSMAWVEYRLKNYTQAWEQITRAISFDPVESEIWEHYGDIAMVLGKRDEAKKAYTRAIELDPNRPDLIAKKVKAVIQPRPKDHPEYRPQDQPEAQ